MRIGKLLKSELLAAGVVAALLSVGCATVDTSKDWVDMKGQKEMHALYADKTLSGWWAMGDRSEPYVVYSRADGNALFILQDKRHPFTWTVVGDDQVCTKAASSSPNCYRYQRHATRAGVYRAFNVATKRYGGDIKVEDGVPKDR